MDWGWGEGGYSRSRRSPQLLNVGHCVCGPSRTKPRQTEPTRAVLSCNCSHAAGRLWRRRRMKMKPCSGSDCSNQTPSSSQMLLLPLMMMITIMFTCETKNELNLFKTKLNWTVEHKQNVDSIRVNFQDTSGLWLLGFGFECFFIRVNTLQKQNLDLKLNFSGKIKHFNEFVYSLTPKYSAKLLFQSCVGVVCSELKDSTSLFGWAVWDVHCTVLTKINVIYNRVE